MAPGAPRPVNRAWIKKHVIDHVIDGDGCAQYGIAWSSSMLELRLRSELKLYAIPANMGRFEYGLQAGLPNPSSIGHLEVSSSDTHGTRLPNSRRGQRTSVNARRETAKKMHDAGHSYREIAKTLGCSASTVFRMVNE